MATKHRGQALMELALGMLALTIVVCALCTFTLYIVKSLKAQNLNRGDPPKFKADVTDLGL